MKISFLALSQLALASLACGGPLTPDQVWTRYADSLNNTVRGQTRAQRLATANAVVKHFNSRRPTFFGTLTGEGMEYLFEHVTTVQYDDYGQGRGHTTKIGDMAKTLKAAEIENMIHSVCAMWTFVLDKIPRDQILKMSDLCRDFYFATLRGQGVLRGINNISTRVSTVAAIPFEWIAANPQINAGSLRVNLALSNNSTLKMLSDSTWSKMVEEDRNGENMMCQYFNVQHFDHLKKGQRSKVSPGCLARLGQINAVPLRNVSEYPKNIFSRYNGALHEDTIKKITAEQLAVFGNKDGSCRNLDLSKLSKDAMHSLSADCLHQRMMEIAPGNPAAVIGQNLAVVPSSSFTKKDNIEMFSRFSPEDYIYFSTEVLQFIIDEAVEHIAELDDTPKYLRTSSAANAKVTAESFERLASKSPALASQILAQAISLPDNVLSKCGAETILGLFGENGKKESVKGLEFLAYLSSRNKISNFGKIISTMSEAADSHICTKIDDSRAYLEMSWLRPHIGKSCVENLAFATDAAVLAKAPELANKSDEAWRAALENFTEEDWKNVSPSLFAVFAAHEGFANGLVGRKDFLAQLNEKALKELTPQCAHALREQITVAMIPKLRDNVFALFAFEEMKSFNLKTVTIGQISFISTLLPETRVKEHYFANVVAADLTGLEAARFNAISATQWAVVSNEVLKAAFTVEKVKALPATNLTKLTDAQMEVFTEDVLLAFTADQIESMGKEVVVAGKRLPAALKAFDKVMGKLGDARREIIKKRHEEIANINNPPKPTDKPAEESTSNTWIWFVAGGCGVVVVIAIIVFLVMRRRQASHFSK